MFYIFKMELNLLPDLLNTGFTIIEIGLFCGVNTGKVNMQIPDLFLQDSNVY